MSTDVAEVLSGPFIAASTRAASSTPRQSGPMRSRLGVSGIPPFTGTRPNVGRRPTTPHRSAGFRIDPSESVPMANAHSPAATADPDPELDPPAGSCKFQGFGHAPRNHSYPLASSAVASFPNSTAPASR